ncbi:MAG: 50S ribosome-binding GTPase, partial [Oscillospiraceae bacterium]|nr:50S ribosome-binding GTPase [Oscillospiraceae bacterium]
MNTKSAIITIAGRPNVGKSTLTNYLVGEKIAIVSNKPQTTRNRICGIVTREDTQFVFVDTPGFHKARTKLGDYMVNVSRESIANVDATILVVEPIASIGPQEEGLIEQIRASKS